MTKRKIYINMMPAPQKVYRSPAETVSVAGGLTATSALRELADWLDANDLQPAGPITISHTTLATYACTTVAQPIPLKDPA